MQSYAMSSAPPQGPKNYVFVDEHNRHKRLKVMRACEGCRRRKIKCDSATTNTWPCAACVRLKLHCVPPAGGLEGDEGADEQLGPSFQTNQAPNLPQSQHYQSTNPPYASNPSNAYGYDAYAANYQKQVYPSVEKPYSDFYPESEQYQEAIGQGYQHVAQPYGDRPRYDERAPSSPLDQQTAEDLLEHLGQLKIADTGVAGYIRAEKSTKELDLPIQEPEPEPRLAAAFSTGAGSQIRIPPALMPSQDEALQAFDTYFANVHPYVPVLNRSHFYHQWHTDPSSISPLVLEAIFANAGRLSDDPAQGAQWLALANSEFDVVQDTMEN
jgi:hypothetical protein